MIPTRDNLQLFVTASVVIAVSFSLLLFIVEKIRKRKLKWGGFIVFAVAGYGVPMLGLTTKLVADISAKKNEATTTGIVVAHDLPNHNQYQFEYAVGGQKYSAWHQGTVDCGPDDIDVGGKFTVYYDPMRPTRADLCSFKGAVKNDLQVLGLLSVLLAFTALVTRKSR